MILIIRGGDRFVDAASDIAALSGIPPFLIGATVVSFATTLPEILVSVTAAFNGQADMAAGNAIGSVTANTAMILALSVIFLPGAVDRSRVLPKSVLLIAAILVLWLSGLCGTLTPVGSLGLLLLFGVFVFENITSAKHEAPFGKGEVLSKSTIWDTTPIQRESCHRMVTEGLYQSTECDSYVTRETNHAIAHASLPKNVLFFLLGAGEIILGSRLLVDNGTLIATDVLHISERIVSLTMVAVGTSLPELVTAISAIIKRKGSLTVGNILGANIIDTLLILPLCSLTQGGVLPLSRSTVLIDLPFCLLSVIVLLIPALIRGRFSRLQGIFSLLLYLIYTALLFVIG